MGYIELASATKLVAWYIKTTRTLHLLAEGELPSNARDVHFVQETKGVSFDPIFALKWIVDEVTNRMPEHYTEHKPFPGVHFESKNVVIRTKEFPDGKSVKITEILTPAELQVAATASATIESLPAASAKAAYSDTDDFTIPIFIPVGQAFELSERIPGASFGMIDTDYDDKSLKMLNASYRSGSIYWKLEGLKVGYTTFIITTWDIPGPGRPRKVVISIEEPVFRTQAAATTAPAATTQPAALPAPAAAAAPAIAPAVAPPVAVAA